MNNKSYTKLLSALAGILLLLAVPSIWPYGYYQLLRWVVAAIAVYNAYTAHQQGKSGWMIVMIGIAILFNPIAPIFLSKEIWAVIDVIAAVVMFVSIRKIAPKKET